VAVIVGAVVVVGVVFTSGVGAVETAVEGAGL